MFHTSTKYIDYTIKYQNWKTSIGTIQTLTILPFVVIASMFLYVIITFESLYQWHVFPFLFSFNGLFYV